MEMKQQLIEKVRVFREAFGLKQDDKALHMNLLNEECSEFLEAGTRADQADALADIVFVSAGGWIDCKDDYMHRYIYVAINQAEDLEIDLLRATKTVFDSNMSKLCNEKQIVPTGDKYAINGVPVHFEQVGDTDTYRCICSESVIGRDGKEYPKGKLLKSVGYRSPDWSYLGEVA